MRLVKQVLNAVGITLPRFPKDLFIPSIEPKLLAQLSAFLFYPQVKIHFACS